MAKVLFKQGTLSQYTSLGTKDPNTLYFITDTHKIYKGDVDYTDSVIIGTIPGTGIQGKLYIDDTTGEVKVYVGSAWKTISPGYVGSMDDANLPANADKLVTVTAVKEFIEAANDAASGEVSTHAAVEATTTQLGHVKVDGTTITAADGTISVGTIAQSKVTNLTTDLAAKAPKANPTFTGTVTLPAANPTADTQAAHKGYVDAQDEATLTSAKAYADSILGANDAMLYKGTIGTGGTVTALPATHEVGWTYKVITAGTYAGTACEIGDMIICVAAGSSASDADWTVVQNNIDGAVTGPASAVDNRVAVFDGTSGKVIADSGYTIAKSVPSNAEFTDTTYSISASPSGSASINLSGSDDVDSSVAILGTSDATVTSDGTDITVDVKAGVQNMSVDAELDNADVNITLSDTYGESVTTKVIAGTGITFDVGVDNKSITINADSLKVTDIVLTGYSKPSSTSPIETNDTLNAAIGKLERALDDKAAVDHTHTSADVTALTGYTTSGVSAGAVTVSDTLNQALAKLDVSKAPKANPTFTGTVTLPAANPTADTQATHKGYVDAQDEATLTAAEAYVDAALTWQTI